MARCGQPHAVEALTRKGRLTLEKVSVMFVVTLRFAANKAEASRFMDAHNAWISRGFDDGVFLMTGSLRPSVGGALLANGVSRQDLEARVQADPFVANHVVTADIIEIAPGRTDARLAVLSA